MGGWPGVLKDLLFLRFAAVQVLQLGDLESSVQSFEKDMYILFFCGYLLYDSFAFQNKHISF